MARQDGASHVIRDSGDACPHPNCPGFLRDWRPDTLLCDGCARAFPIRIRVGNREELFGYVPDLDIPEEAIDSLAVSLHRKHEQAREPNPVGQSDWEELPSAVREQWRQEARSTLVPMWNVISPWFESLAFLTARGRAAMGALKEIAIPSMKYCEEKYGYDDQARLNVEAAIRE